MPSPFSLKKLVRGSYHIPEFFGDIRHIFVLSNPKTVIWIPRLSEEPSKLGFPLKNLENFLDVSSIFLVARKIFCTRVSILIIIIH